MEKYVKIPSKCHNHEAHPSRRTKEGVMRNEEEQNKRHTQTHGRTDREEPQKLTVSRKLSVGLNQFYPRETSFLFLMLLKITDICSVRIGVLYLICETSHCNTYNQKYCDETKQRDQWRSEARTQDNHKKDRDWLDHRH